MQAQAKVLPLTAPASALEIERGACKCIAQHPDASALPLREYIENRFEQACEMLH